MNIELNFPTLILYLLPMFCYVCSFPYLSINNIIHQIKSLNLLQILCPTCFQVSLCSNLGGTRPEDVVENICKVLIDVRAAQNYNWLAGGNLNKLAFRELRKIREVIRGK